MASPPRGQGLPQLAAGLVLGLGAWPLASAGPTPTPSFSAKGYVVEWVREPRFTGMFTVEGVEVSRSECRAAGETSCREVVELGWVVRKVAPDPLDRELPEVCAEVRVSGEVTVVGRNRWCDELGLGASAAHAVQLAVPLTDGGQPLDTSLVLGRLAASGGALQSLGSLSGSWLLGGSLRRWVTGVVGVDLPWAEALLLAGGLAVLVAVGWWWSRRRTARRAALVEELARIDEEIRAAEAGAPAVGAAQNEPREVAVASLRSARPVPAAIEAGVTPDEVQPGARSVARFDVRVSTTDGAPAAGVRLRMVADGGPVGRVFADRTTVTDPEGRASLDVRVPLIAEGRRLYFTAEVTGVGDASETLRSRTWVRVRDVALEVRPGRLRVQRGTDGGTSLLAVLRDDAGEPVEGVELRCEVVDAGGGTLTPGTVVTDARGRAELLYSAGDRPGEVRVRIWPEGEPQLAREIVVEQTE